MSVLLENVALFVLGAIVVIFVCMAFLGFALLAIILGIYGYYFSAVICLVVQLVIWSSSEK